MRPIWYNTIFLITFFKWYENIEGNSSDARKTAVAIFPPESLKISHTVTRWHKLQTITKYSLCSYMTTHCAPVHIWLYTSKHFIWQNLDIDRKNTVCCTQCVRIQLIWENNSKTCLIRPLKIDKTKIIMTNDSLMKVKSIAECSLWSILQYFWPALSDNCSWKPLFKREAF